MLINTSGIVLSALKFSEADLIIKCFTEKSGVKDYLLRGVLKSKKGKFRVSLFQPLTQLEIVVNHRDKGRLEYMQEAKILKSYQSLHTNIRKSSVVLFLAEVLKNAIKEEEQNPELYLFLQEALDWFDTQSSAPNFHLYFLLVLTRYLGFFPDHSCREAPVFNLVDGTFERIKRNEDCITGENVLVLQQLLGTNFEKLSSIKLNQSARSGFLLMLLRYYEIHLQGFHKPKSLAVLNEIYS